MRESRDGEEGERTMRGKGSSTMGIGWHEGKNREVDYLI